VVDRHPTKSDKIGLTPDETALAVFGYVKAGSADSITPDLTNKYEDKLFKARARFEKQRSKVVGDDIKVFV